MADIKKIKWGANEDQIDDIVAKGVYNGNYIATLPTLTANATLAITSDLNNYLPLTGGTVSGTIKPNSNYTLNLGGGSNVWKNLYTQNVQFKNVDSADTSITYSYKAYCTTSGVFKIQTSNGKGLTLSDDKFEAYAGTSYFKLSDNNNMTAFSNEIDFSSAYGFSFSHNASGGINDYVSSGSVGGITIYSQDSIKLNYTDGSLNSNIILRTGDDGVGRADINGEVINLTPSNDSSLDGNRIKIGGLEVVRTEDYDPTNPEDSTSTSVIFTYKPTNSSYQVVPFAITQSGYVYYKGEEVSTFSGSYSDLSNKPTIPATNVIPTNTTANKVLLSTTTSGTATWSNFNTAGFLKTNSSGVISVDTTTYLNKSKISYDTTTDTLTIDLD